MEETFFLTMLDEIEKRILTIKPQTIIEKGHSGNIIYKVSNGWKIIVFLDCGEFDYIDSFISPTGEETDPFKIESFNMLRNYNPPAYAQMAYYKVPYIGGVILYDLRKEILGEETTDLDRFFSVSFSFTRNDLESKIYDGTVRCPDNWMKEN